MKYAIAILLLVACSFGSLRGPGLPCEIVEAKRIDCVDGVDSCYVTWVAPKECAGGWWYAMVGVGHYRVPWTFPGREFTLGFTVDELTFLLKESM
jgi:hypothetical protein